jgi:hypothetical protein
MRTLKAMYRSGDILARIISEMFAHAAWRMFFVTLFSGNFAVEIALITWSYLRN